jgi:hypothetical protein
MSFRKHKVIELKQLLKQFEDNHFLDHKHLRKPELIKEMNKRFIIHDNKLHSKPPMDPQTEEVVGGNAKNAGYVKRLEAENKIIFERIKGKGPSKYMVEKYGNKQPEPKEIIPVPPFLKRNLKAKPKKKKEKVTEVEQEYEQPVFEPAPATEPIIEKPLFDDKENLDFDVSNKKPKKKKEAKKTITEAEEERLERERHEELEKKKEELNHLESLKKKLTAYRKAIQKENSQYHDALDGLKQWAKLKKILQNQGRKNVKKEEVEQEIIKKHHNKITKIKSSYPEIIEYIKKKKLNENDLNEVYKNLRRSIKFAEKMI